MKKTLLILLFYSCSDDKQSNLKNPQIAQIDSISKYMDTAVFDIENLVKEEGVVEDYDSYTIYYNKEFPQFTKYRVHNHNPIFIDSVFYFHNDNLIKFMAKKTKNHKVFDSIGLYFNTHTLIGNETVLDSNTTKSLLKVADLHLKEIKKRINQ